MPCQSCCSFSVVCSVDEVFEEHLLVAGECVPLACASVEADGVNVCQEDSFERSALGCVV